MFSEISRELEFVNSKIRHWEGRRKKLEEDRFAIVRRDRIRNGKPEYTADEFGVLFGNGFTFLEIMGCEIRMKIKYPSYYVVVSFNGCKVYMNARVSHTDFSYMVYKVVIGKRLDERTQFMNRFYTNVLPAIHTYLPITELGIHQIIDDYIKPQIFGWNLERYTCEIDRLISNVCRLQNGAQCVLSKPGYASTTTVRVNENGIPFLVTSQKIGPWKRELWRSSCPMRDIKFAIEFAFSTFFCKICPGCLCPQVKSYKNGYMAHGCHGCSWVNIGQRCFMCGNTDHGRIKQYTDGYAHCSCKQLSRMKKEYRQAIQSRFTDVHKY